MYHLRANPKDNNVCGKTQVLVPFSHFNGAGEKKSWGGVPPYAQQPGPISRKSSHSHRNFSKVTYIIGTATNMYFHFLWCNCVGCNCGSFCQHNQRYLIRFVLSVTHPLSPLSFSICPLECLLGWHKAKGWNGEAERTANKYQKKEGSEFIWATGSWVTLNELHLPSCT